MTMPTTWAVACALVACALLSLFPCVSGQDDDPCHTSYKDQTTCGAADLSRGAGLWTPDAQRRSAFAFADAQTGVCTWCKCGALPSSCWTVENAKKLPPGVYQCDSLNASIRNYSHPRFLMGNAASIDAPRSDVDAGLPYGDPYNGTCLKVSDTAQAEAAAAPSF